MGITQNADRRDKRIYMLSENILGFYYKTHFVRSYCECRCVFVKVVYVFSYALIWPSYDTVNTVTFTELSLLDLALQSLGIAFSLYS